MGINNAIFSKKLYITFVAMVFSFFMVQAEAYSQTPPKLVFPIADAECVSQVPTLEWNPVASAIMYPFQVALDENFTQMVQQSVDYDKKDIKLNKLDPETVYYWRAGAIFSGDQTIYWSAARKFTTSVELPTLLLPANNASCQEFRQTLSWVLVQNATGYQVQVSEKADFSSTATDTTFTKNIDNLSIQLSKGYTNYYWRVATVKGACKSEWSDTYSFQTKTPSPTITYPANNTKGVAKSFEITWATTSGANSYDLQVSSTSDFSTLLQNLSNITGNDVHVELEDYNTNYFVRMKANSASCNSEWSEANTFTTQYEKTTLEYPANQATCIPFQAEVSWTKMPKILSYILQVSYDFNFSTKYLDLKVYSNDTTITLLEPNKTHFWRIKASDTQNDGEWSDVSQFTSTIEAPVPLYPDNRQMKVGLSTEIRWKYLSAINGPYRLQIAKDSLFTDMVLDDATAIADVYKKLSTNFLPDYNTTYYWRVYAQYDPCISSWSKTFSFTTVRGIPDPISPENKVENQPLSNRFTWANDSVSYSYNIEFSLDENFSKVENNLSMTHIGATAVDINNFLPYVTYYWRVRGNNDWGKGPWSEVFSFTTGQAQAGVPVLLYPSDNTTKISLDTLVTWTAVDSAIAYRIQISDKSNFSNLIVDDTVETNSYSIDKLNNFTEYYWRVAAINSTQESAFSSKRLFRTLAKKITQVAEITSPANEATGIDTSNVYFAWKAVPEAEAYKGGSYTLELIHPDSTSARFTTYQPNYSLFTTLAANTKYSWKVIPSNEAGAGPASEVFTFYTKENLTSVEKAPDFEIFPNPSTEYFELGYIAEADETSIVEISNINGQVVLTYHFVNKQRYDITSLVPGRYNIAVKTGKNTLVKSFIKK